MIRFVFVQNTTTVVMACCPLPLQGGADADSFAARSTGAAALGYVSPKNYCHPARARENPNRMK
ncbi:MAG: hypothetical protein FWD31_08885 [Planctomycetaceae bacterium]|nr:hypothetical protein [Planctomycetaceae bacterium]